MFQHCHRKLDPCLVGIQSKYLFSRFPQWVWVNEKFLKYQAMQFVDQKLTGIMVSSPLLELKFRETGATLVVRLLPFGVKEDEIQRNHLKKEFS